MLNPIEPMSKSVNEITYTAEKMYPKSNSNIVKSTINLTVDKSTGKLVCHGGDNSKLFLCIDDNNILSNDQTNLLKCFMDAISGSEKFNEKDIMFFLMEFKKQMKETNEEHELYQRQINDLSLKLEELKKHNTN